MTMKRWLIAAIGLAGVACLLPWVSWRRDETATVDQDHTVEVLTKKLHALEQRVVTLQTRPAPSWPAHAQAEEDSSPAPQDPHGAPADAKEPPSSAEQRLATAAAALEDTFYAEPKDGVWSSSMVARITGSLKTSAPGAHMVEASCASTMCRVVVSHDDVGAQQDLATTLASSGPFTQGVFYDYDRASTPPTTTLYVMREGHKFPRARRAM